jgi:hypothetical protein
MTASSHPRNPFRDVLSETPPPFRFKVTLPFRPKPLPSISNDTTVLGNGTCGLGDRCSSQTTRAQTAFREWAAQKKSSPRGRGADQVRRSLSPRQQYEEQKAAHMRALEAFEQRQQERRLAATAEKKLVAGLLRDREVSEASELHAAILMEQQQAHERREALAAQRLKALLEQKDHDRALAERHREELVRSAAEALQVASELRQLRLDEHRTQKAILMEASVARRSSIDRDRKQLAAKLSKQSREAAEEQKQRRAFASQVRREVQAAVQQARDEYEQRVYENAKSIKQNSVEASRQLRHLRQQEQEAEDGSAQARLQKRRALEFASRNSVECAMMAKQLAAEKVRAECRRLRAEASSPSSTSQFSISHH